MKILNLQSAGFVRSIFFGFCIFSNSVEAQLLELSPVTVTASKFEESVLTTPSHLTIISQDEIQQSGVSTVNEAIMRLGGVTGRPSQQGGAEYTLDIMGFGDTAMLNTVIVIDGIPMREADQSESRLSGIPIDQVVRIEIQRGAASVVYGEGAAAGVINIITKASGLANNSRGSSGSVSMTTGSNALQEQRANLNINQNELNFSVSAFHRGTNGERTNSASSSESFSSTLQYRTADIRSGIYASVDNAKSRLPGPFYTIEQYLLTPLAASTPLDWSNSQTNRIGAFAEKNIGDFLYKIDVNQRNRDLSSFLHSSPSDINSKYITTANFVSLTANQFSDLSAGNLQGIYGVEFYNWDQSRMTDAALNNEQVIKSQSISLFGKLEQQIRHSGTVLNGGLRIENLTRSSRSADVTTDYAKELYAAEVGLSQSLAENTNAFARLAQSYRAPNADEFACSLGYPCNNTNSLQPQVSTDYEVGLKYWSKDLLRLSSRLYTSYLSNEIAYNPDSSINSNLTPTKRSGVDFNAVYKPHATVYIGINLGLRQSIFRDGAHQGNVIPMAPGQVSSLQGDWQFLPQHSVGIGWTNIGKQYFTGNVANDPQFSVPAYGLTDLRYRYQAHDFEILVSINNIADKKFYSYGTMYGGGYYGIYPDLGRAMMVRFKYNFK